MTLKIYKFGESFAEGDSSMKEVLGGKGANLAEMAGALNLPVPPGFTIPTSACLAYLTAAKSGALDTFNANVSKLTEQGLSWVMEGLDYMPLLSVRSGARVSMPGMMDTILNVGLTTETLPFWRDRIGDRAALDSYRRLIQMYSSVAMGVPLEEFEEQLEEVKQSAGVTTDSDLTPAYLTRLIKRYKEIVVAHTGQEFPDDLLSQLRGAINAVFSSWDNPRAMEYRKINNIPYEWGTAVTVQTMVFGNLNDKSATGVLFSRQPSTGQNAVTGDFLVNAQGEDVVAGIRTPEPLSKMNMWNTKVYKQLMTYVSLLESHYRDMQDIEFTVQDGKLWILQTRNGKRSAQAAFQIAYDLVKEGMIGKHEVAGRVQAEQLYVVLRDRIDPTFKTPPTGKGIAAGGDIVTGLAVFSAESAINCTSPCILVTKETNPDDIAGMNAARGILTATGGLTSHAAVVARGMNKTCVVGTTGLSISGKWATLGDQKFYENAKVTIDGSTGNIWIGIDVPLIAGGVTPLVKEVISWMSPDKYAERVELSRTMTPEQVVEAMNHTTAETVYVDVVKLLGSDRFSTNPQGTLQRIEALGKGISSCKAKRVLVNLSAPKDHYSTGDSVYDFMFGVPQDEHSKLAYSVGLWGPNPKVLLVLGESMQKHLDILKKAGFKVMGNVQTFADLLESGPMNITPETIQKVFGTTEAFELAKSLVEAKFGKKSAEPLPTPQYWYESLVKKEV